MSELVGLTNVAEMYPPNRAGSGFPLFDQHLGTEPGIKSGREGAMTAGVGVPRV